MKLAIISLSTFGYFERMADKAIEMGVPAVFFDERPSNGFWVKFFLRAMPKSFARWFVRRHVHEQLAKIAGGGFTHALIVFAEVYSVTDIELLKSKGIRVSRFTWDSTQNRASVVELDNHMYAVGSFDPDDCSQYGYKYIPLYSEGIAPANVNSASDRSIDFYFCGTVHTDRASILHQMQQIAEEKGWSVRWQLFFHSRFAYYLKNFRDKAALALYPQITSTSFPHTEILQLSRESRIVVDIHHAKQSGLTMRSYEALAQGAVLLTTNERALTAITPDLADRVVYLDRANLRASMDEAVKRTCGPLKQEQYYELSHDRFMRQIFSLLGITSPDDKSLQRAARHYS
ncbi:MAG: hypothetical protein ABJ242_03385 [Marinomonas sp.]